jgi:hypothetical protein
LSYYKNHANINKITLNKIIAGKARGKAKGMTQLQSWQEQNRQGQGLKAAQLAGRDAGALTGLRGALPGLALALALGLYGTMSAPTPDRFGVVELIILALLLAAIGPSGALALGGILAVKGGKGAEEGGQKRARPIKISWLILCGAGLLAALIEGVRAAQLWRDLIALAGWGMPLALRGRLNSFGLLALWGGLLLAGVAFCGRFLGGLPTEFWSLVLGGQSYRGDLLYLFLSPTLLLLAALCPWLIFYSSFYSGSFYSPIAPIIAGRFWGLVGGKILARIGLCGALIGAGGAACLALIITQQRLAIILLGLAWGGQALMAVYYVARKGVYQLNSAAPSPRQGAYQAAPLCLVVGAVLVGIYGFAAHGGRISAGLAGGERLLGQALQSIEQIYGALAEKTQQSGDNNRMAEIKLVFSQFAQEPLSILVGRGWGAFVTVPSIPGRLVGYVHNLPLYVFYKAGLVGLLAAGYYWWLLALPIWQAARIWPAGPWLGAVAALLPGFSLYTSYKFFCFSLLVTALYLTAEAVITRANARC